MNRLLLRLLRHPRVARRLARSLVGLQVLQDGRWHEAKARVVLPGDDAYQALGDAYRARWKRTVLLADQPLVQIGPRSSAPRAGTRQS